EGLLLLPDPVELDAFLGGHAALLVVRLALDTAHLLDQLPARSLSIHQRHEYSSRMVRAGRGDAERARGLPAPKVLALRTPLALFGRRACVYDTDSGLIGARGRCSRSISVLCYAWPMLQACSGKSRGEISCRVAPGARAWSPSRPPCSGEARAGARYPYTSGPLRRAA